MEDKNPQPNNSSQTESQNYNALLSKLYSENIKLQNELLIQKTLIENLKLEQAIYTKNMQQLHEENGKLNKKINELSANNSNLSTPQNTPPQIYPISAMQISHSITSVFQPPPKSGRSCNLQK